MGNYDKVSRGEGAGEEGVFNGAQCIFMAPSARFAPQLMEDLFD